MLNLFSENLGVMHLPNVSGMEDREPATCLDDHVTKLRLINTISGVTSCVFLVITFLVYVSVPELNSLHGKIVISNVVSILFLTAYLVLVYHGSHTLPPLHCKIFGYIGYFFALSMISWMTVMSLDLCWTFLRAQVPRRSSATIKFIIYSLAGWGLSLLLTLGLVLVDTLEPVSVQVPGLGYVTITQPRVGEEKCFLSDRSQGLYLHLPSLVLMLVNAILFLVTIITIYRSVRVRVFALISICFLHAQLIFCFNHQVKCQNSKGPGVSRETEEASELFLEVRPDGQGQQRREGADGALHQAVHRDGHLLDLRVRPSPGPL